jgi:hypothetical protein
MKTIVRTLLLLALVAAAERSASAATRRLALVVGHYTGSGDRPPLRYAEEDAGKLAQVLIEMGDVDRADLLLVQGKGLREMKKALERVNVLAASARAQAEDRVLVLFYYSGHSDGISLELGNERFSFDELKTWLAGTGADVRIAIVDSCKSGSLVRNKGGKPGPSFQINLIDQLSTTGDALLTSSAADELALESEEIRGSYFTHHFVSGLRGAADESGDGRVTLAEAYEYSFNRTVTATSATGVTPQHPRYDYRLSGQGELVVTELSRPSSAIEAPAGFERLLVVNVRRQQVIAELTSDKIRRVAVAPGDYAVRAWKGGESVAGRFAVARGEVKSIAWSDLGTTARATIRQKGAPAGSTDDPIPPEVADHLLAFGPAPGYAVYRGPYKKPVAGADFYRMVGRDDLAGRYARRKNLRRALIIGGATVAVAGTLYAVTGDDPDCGVFGDMEACYRDDPDRAERREEARRRVGTGLTMVALGAVPVLVGAFINPHPVDVPTAHRLGHEYNQKLLGEATAPSRPERSTARVDISPYLTPDGHGAGVILGARF